MKTLQSFQGEYKGNRYGQVNTSINTQKSLFVIELIKATEECKHLSQKNLNLILQLDTAAATKRRSDNGKACKFITNWLHYLGVSGNLRIFPEKTFFTKTECLSI